MNKRAKSPDHSPIPKPKFDPTLTDRERAIQALAMMKQLEKERKKKMVTVQVDDRTIITSTKKRAAQLAAEYLGKK